MAFAITGRAGDVRPSTLLVARIGGAERAVAGASGEAPVGWTPAGELVTREGRATLRLRRPDGTLVRTLVRGGRRFEWDPASRTAVVADGRRVRRVGSGLDVALADLRSLGRGGPRVVPNVEIAEAGRIVLAGPRALVVLRSDGSLWARAPFPRAPEIARVLSTSPDGRTIAFAKVRHRAEVMSVELLREGQGRSSTPVSRRVAARSPAWSTGLAWRGRWLLSWTTDGAVTALRPDKGEQIRLDRLGRALAAGRSPQSTGVLAHWGGP